MAEEIGLHNIRINERVIDITQCDTSIIVKTLNGTVIPPKNKRM